MISHWKLAIDTSGPESSVALLNESHCYFRASAQQVSHNQILFSLVEELLAEAKILLSDLEIIAVGSGPGSFTGLRVSYAYAKGLSFALRIPLLSASSLKAAAATATASVGSAIVVISDARREEVFCGAYMCSAAGELQTLEPEKILALSEISPLIDRLSTETGKNVELLSFQTELLASLRCAGSAVKDVAVGLSKIIGHAGQHIGHETEARQWNLAHLAALSPNYLRAVSAKTIEERLEIGS